MQKAKKQPWVGTSRWAVLGLLLWPLVGNAQPSTDSDLQRVEITGLKRSELADRAALTTNVLSAGDVRDAGLLEFGDIAQVVPGLSFGNAGARGGPGYLSVRGIVNNNNVIDPGVAIYLDGVPIGDFWSYGQRLFDIERVEVLKGPQGPLYGVNSQAGVINIVSRRPSADLQGRAQAGAGSWSTRYASASLSGPLGDDRLLFSAALSADRRGGYIDNLLTGTRHDGQDGTAGRVKLRWQPTEPLRVDLLLMGARTRDDNGLTYLPVDRASYSASPQVRPLALDRYDIAVDRGYSNSSTRQAALAATYSTPAFDLVLTSATRRNRLDQLYDLDFTPARLLQNQYLLRFDETNHEVRLQSPADNDARLTWTLGVARNEIDRRYDFPVRALADLGFLPAGTYDFFGASRLEGANTGVFAQATWRVLDRAVGLTAGLRRDRTERSINRAASPIGFPGQQATVSHSAWLPMVGVDWRTSNHTLVYANLGRGWKSGGLNPTAQTLARSIYQPEYSTTLDAGVKMRITPGLQVNAAVFHNRLSDYQDGQSDGAGSFYLGNAKRAHTQGVEFDARWNPTPQWTLTGALGLVSAKFDDYLFDPNSGLRLDGQPLRQVPKHNYALAAKYRHESGLSLVGELRGSGAFSELLFNSQAGVFDRFDINGHRILNLRVGYEAPRWSAWVVGRNLTDAYYFKRTESSGPFSGYSQPMGVVGEPRFLGIELNFTL
jgi:iron complex outermembrane receptor protein